MKYKVLIIDDEPLIRITLESGLSDLNYEARSAENIAEGLKLTEEFLPDAVLLDNRIGADLGIDHIREFKKLDEDVMVVLMTAYGSVSHAVQAMKQGADDYVQKPFDLDEVDIIIRRGMEQRTSRRSLKLMKLRPHKLLGESPAIRRIRDNISVLAQNDNVDLLVCGETGTGKEVVVTSIHENSSRKDNPMVKINCGAIPENLLESELFGYEKGAFTGANKTKKGLIELANGGTVFLDEIGEMPLFMQAKLLTFLEDRRFKRVGGLRDIEVNVRVIAATNRDLEEESQAGRFREDLYYRLNVMRISIPPLRERIEDIPIISQFYLEYFNRKFHKELTGIHPDFMAAMQNYYWKGNVRELRNVMERSVLFARGELLTGEESGLLQDQSQPVTKNKNCFPLKDLKQGPVDLKQELDALERDYIDRAMALTDGNLSRAAQLLGCTRFTLKRRLEPEN